MKRVIVITVLALLGCSGKESRQIVRGPHGVFAEIISRENGASAENAVEVTLFNQQRSASATVFKGYGSSTVNVKFVGDKLVVLEYCSASRFEATGYLYSLGDEYAFSDVRFAVATVESQIGDLRLCPKPSRDAVPG